MTDELEEDDPVVNEIDIYMAKALANRVYLFQYPVRPSFLTYDNTEHINARIKPKQQRVELELALDVDSSTYCLARGEQIATLVDSSSSSEPYYQSQHMDKQVLTSVKSSESTGRYVAGILKNGELHLTPVQGFVQLRPSFEYLNKSDDNKQTKSSANIGDSNDEEEEAKVITTRFAKPETDEIAKKKKLSYSNIEQKLAEEPWAYVRYYQPTTTKASSDKMLLYCHQKDFDSPEFTATSREYLNILSPKFEDDNSQQAEPRHGILSLASLKKMHIADQIKCILVNAKVIQFHHILTILGPNFDEKTVLKGLNEFAVLVQGCWVVKSNILYAKGTKCQISGIPAESIWPARDYVLWLFNQKRLLERKNLVSAIRIPSEELRDMLEQVARQKPPQNWEFVLPTDIDFLQKHQDVVKFQIDVWNDLVARFKQSLNVSKIITTKSDEILPGLDANLHIRHRITKPRSKSRDSTEKSSKRNSFTEEEKSPSKKKNINESNREGERIKINDTNLDNRTSNGNDDIMNCPIKVEHCSIPRIKKEPLEYNETSENEPSEMVVDSENHDLKFVSNCDVDSAPFIPPAATRKAPISIEKPPSEIFLQELDKFIKTTLKGGCLCLAEFREILQLRQQEPGNILCSGVTDEMLEERILKVGASQINIKWPENVVVSSEKGKIFAFRRTGDSMDKYRKVTLDMFSEVFCFKRSELNNRFQQLFGSTLSNHIFPRFVGEFCEKYGKSWYLRGTYKIANPNR